MASAATIIHKIETIELNVKVIVPKTLKMRVWVGSRIMVLGALIMGSNAEIEVK